MARHLEALEGTWVYPRGKPTLVGFCTEVTGLDATVEFFRVPRVVDRCEVFDARTLESVWLRNGSFVWIETNGVFRPVTVQVRGGQIANYRPITVVGQRQRLWPDQYYMLVSTESAIDPIAALKGMLLENPEGLAARHAFLLGVLDQRAAYRGFDGVASAAVFLFQHQLDVVSRVMGDPSMRYILADEVGLGKTVEAGLVIRQMLLDSEDSRVIVASPGALRGQWIDELSNQMHMERIMRVSPERLRVLTHEELDDRLSADLLVVDEAHRLGTDPRLFELVRRLSGKTSGLLLLTATPMHGNAQTFLRLLHLVDPSIYRVDDLANFQRLLDMRLDQALAVERLDPSVPSFILQGVLNQIGETFPEDPVVARHIASAGSEERSKSIPAMQRLSDHVRQTYRISRRVIRHRRESAEAAGFPVSGRSAQLLSYSDSLTDFLDDRLEQWRLAILDSPHLRDEAVMVFSRAFEARLGGRDSFRRSMVERLDGRMGSAAPDETERALLVNAIARIESSGPDPKVSSLANYLVTAVGEQDRRGVVFFGHTADARAARDYLATMVGLRTSSHLLGMNLEDQDKAVREFVGGVTFGGGQQDRRDLLLADASAEEGRNLQASDFLCNFDIPFDFNRIEQRLGRVDRFRLDAAGTPVTCSVLLEDGSKWAESYWDLLTTGLGVMDRSVATLQRPLAKILDRLQLDLLLEGRDGLTVDIEAIKEELVREAKNIAQLEFIESELDNRDFQDRAFAELRRLEENTTVLRERWNNLVAAEGGIRFDTRSHEGSEALLVLNKDSPNVQGALPQASDELTDIIRLSSTKAVTFDRDLAVRDITVVPMRIGNAIHDWIEHEARHGERGRASLAVIPGDGIDPELWIRFDFLVEVNSSTWTTDGVHASRLRRRGEALMPARMIEIWCRSDGQGPSDDGQVEELKIRLRDSRVPLGEWANRAKDTFSPWQRTVQDTYEVAQGLLDTEIRESHMIEETLEVIDQYFKGLVRALEVRLERVNELNERAETRADLERMRSLHQDVLCSARSPRIELVSCLGLIVEAGNG